jgi:putative PIN family toxin of toxin-antitoxin system
MVVLDTNVLISGLLWAGPSNSIFRVAERGKIIVASSKPILDELRDVISRPKFRARIEAIQSAVPELLESVTRVVHLVEPQTIPRVVAEDPEDDMFVACALAADAAWIVTGDSHLLEHRKHGGICIVTPRQFWTGWTRRA